MGIYAILNEDRRNRYRINELQLFEVNTSNMVRAAIVLVLTVEKMARRQGTLGFYLPHQVDEVLDITSRMGKEYKRRGVRMVELALQSANLRTPGFSRINIMMQKYEEGQPLMLGFRFKYPRTKIAPGTVQSINVFGLTAPSPAPFSRDRWSDSLHIQSLETWLAIPKIEITAVKPSRVPVQMSMARQKIESILGYELEAELNFLYWKAFDVSPQNCFAARIELGKGPAIPSTLRELEVHLKPIEDRLSSMESSMSQLNQRVELVEQKTRPLRAKLRDLVSCQFWVMMWLLLLALIVAGVIATLT